MAKRNSHRYYTSRRERLYQHYRGWKMLLLLIFLAVAVWVALHFREVLAYLHTFTY